MQLLKDRWVLILTLIAFTAFKIHHLYYPYFWDESWPYAAGVADMYKHGISLVPGAVDPFISRGHPLLFHAAAATWGKLFGMSHVSMHSFALLISLLFLTAIYEGMLKLFNVRVAILSLLLVVSQTIFMVQSSMLLLEVLVAFLAFLSLYHYVRGNYLQTGIYLSMLFLTKESGLIMGFVLGVDALINLRTFSKQTIKEHLARLLSIGIPCIVMGTFFLLQKKINGWYILPLYSDLVEHKWDNFWHVFRNAVNTAMFTKDYRYWYYFIAAILAIYAAVAKKLWWLLAILPPMVLTYYMIGDQGPKQYNDSLVHFLALVVSYALMAFGLSRRSVFSNWPQRHFIILAISFIICFLIFSASNFFTDRYLLATMIPGMTLIAIVVDKATAGTQQWLYFVATAGVLYVSGYSYIHDEGNGDTDRAAFSGMELQQSAVDYLISRNAQNLPVAAASFMHREHLTDPTTGFIDSVNIFHNVKWEITDSTRFVVMDNIEPEKRDEDIRKSPDFKLVLKKDKGLGWLEIYERKAPIPLPPAP
jgi:hypothetical protein